MIAHKIALRTITSLSIFAIGIVGLSAMAARSAAADLPQTANQKLVAVVGGASSASLAKSPIDVAKKTVDGRILDPISDRFAAALAPETPSFRRHVVPLLGKLGCNGRACHGSFQGRGGFRLSLFGYDFKMDHAALMAGTDEPRVNVAKPDASLILQKPTLGIPHEGGKRYELGSWEHQVLKRWIEGGAKGLKPGDSDFVRLEVQPAEINFTKKGEHVTLRAIAHWSDGVAEDVTPLCRYQSNDEQVAKIDSKGVVTSMEPGDSHVVAFYDSGVTPVAVMRPVSDIVGPRFPVVPTPTEIDRLVVNKLRKVGIVPSELCSDGEFLRRVSLDLTGTLPVADEAAAFLADKSPNKRQQKIDQLLERPAYAAWWSTRLCDLTGNNDRALANITPVDQRASTEWYEWMLKRVQANMPYDQLVEKIVLATSHSVNQTYAEYSEEMTGLYRKKPEGAYADRPGLTHYWARRNIVQPQQKALSFAYTFLGVRIQCAECHKHPFDQWTQDDYKDFTKFFGRVRFGTAPADNAERKELTAALNLDTKRLVDIRREYPRLIAEGKTLPFDEVFIDPVRTRGALQAQRPGAKRPQRANMAKAKASRKAEAMKKAKPTKTNTTSIATNEEPPRRAETKSDAKKPDTKKSDAKMRPNVPTDPSTVARKPVVAMRPTTKKPGQGRKGRQPAAPVVLTARLLGSGEVDLTRYDDPRTPLMEWLRSKNNRFFARSFVNRVWANYFNVGIVNPPDDLSLSNPPSNAELLDYLADGFIKHDYDMKWLHREIANSRTYQTSWRPTPTNRLDQRNFSHAVLRRLPAEVAYDALRQATSSDRVVAEMQRDCLTRSIGLAGASRRGRGAGSAYALGLFGRSVRASNCDCDRSNEASLLQTVFLRNDSEVLAMVSDARSGWITQIGTDLAPKPTGAKRGARAAASKPSGGPKAANRRPIAAAKPKTAIADGESNNTQPVSKPVTEKSATEKSVTAKPATEKSAAEKSPAENKMAAAKSKKSADAKKMANAGKQSGNQPEVLRPEQKARRIAQLTQRIREFEDQGNAQQVKLLKARLEDLKRRPTQAGPMARNAGQNNGGRPMPTLKPAQIATAKKEQLVRTLYLRTLSRYPEEREADRALAYLNGSDNLLNGLRDLVWAVVNTEEFIVNH